MWRGPLVFTLAIFLLVWGAAAADLLVGPIGFSVLAYGGLILAALVFRTSDGIGADMGRPAALGGGLALGAALIGLVALVELALAAFSVEGVNPSWPVAVAAGALTQVVVAVGEELPFRGYLLPALARVVGAGRAIVASSAVFSVAHLATILVQGATAAQAAFMFASVFLGGVLLALLYLRGGLGAAMGLHFSWNLLQYSVLGLTGGDAALVVRTAGDDLVTGGALGPEAGLAGLAALGLGVAALGAWSRREAPRRMAHQRAKT